jgi:Ca2+-transporting ATPase
MILWINLVTNGLPALALGIDPPDSTQMQEPPREKTSGLVGTRGWLGILAVGVWMGGTALACYLLPWGETDAFPRHHARALAFSLLALSPLFHAFNCRSPRESVLSIRPFLSKPLLAAVVLSAAIHMVAILVPGLRPIFRTYGMTIVEWEVMLLLSASIVPVVEVLKLFQRLLVKDEAPATRRSGR